MADAIKRNTNPVSTPRAAAARRRTPPRRSGERHQRDDLRPELVGEHTADRAGDDGGRGEQRRARAGADGIHVVRIDGHQVLRQVRRERDEAAEDDRVEERHLPRDGELEGALHLRHEGLSARLPGRRVAQEEPDECGHDDEHTGDQQVGRQVADALREARRGEGRYRRADHAHAEDAVREAAPRGGNHALEKDADGEDRAGDAEQEPATTSSQKLPIDPASATSSTAGTAASRTP
jgi:hypothetical protein